MHSMQVPLIAGLTLAISCATIPQPRDARQALRATEPAWRDWNAEAFAEAREHHKLLLVSVQAGWCHWCHVMNETTYRDPNVLRALERDFVVIRVDNDARPDLAERYRDYGWPATAFLTPDARPIVALRGHQPPKRFQAFLERLGSDLRAGRPLEQATVDLEASDPELSDLAALETVVRAQLDGLYDSEHGGWGSDQKYPVADALEHALGRGTVDGLWRARAIATLEGYAQLIDPVWGGMYQYSVGGTWNAPHFEKIAAIQAGAIDNFSLAFRVTGDTKWIALAKQVSNYVHRFLESEEGPFFSSQDADLGTHGRQHVLRGADYYRLSEPERLRLGLPHVDQAKYANLNGMLIAALAHFGAVSGDGQATESAIDAASSILESHQSQNQLLGHASKDETVFHLTDQVEFARGLLALYETTGDHAWLERAVEIVDATIEHLSSGAGGFFSHTADPTAVGAFADRERPLQANVRMARVLLELHRRTGIDSYRTAALSALRTVANREKIRSRGRMVGDYLLALEAASGSSLMLSVVGEDDQGTERLYEAALRIGVPGRIVERGRPGRSRYPYPGRPAVFLCTDTACSMPVFDAARLPNAVAEFVSSL